MTYYVYVNPDGQQGTPSESFFNLAICTSKRKAQDIAVAWLNWQFGPDGWLPTNQNGNEFVERSSEQGDTLAAFVTLIESPIRHTYYPDMQPKSCYEERA